MTATDSTPAVDVGALRRERELLLLAVDAVARSATHGDARRIAEQARRAVLGPCERGCSQHAEHRGGCTWPAAPMEMDDTLRRALRRDWSP